MTIRFILRGEQEFRQVYLRFTASRDCLVWFKTGYVLKNNEWQGTLIKKGIDKGKIGPVGMPDESTKEGYLVAIKLKALKVYLRSAYNNAATHNTTINREWLHKQMTQFKNL